MRVTTNMISYNFLTSLNNSLARQNSIQEQLSDGKAIHRASDDPVKTIRSLRFNTNLDMNEQFTQNVKDARSWMETTDGAMSDLGQVLMRAKELTIRAVGPNPDIAYEAAATEIDGLINTAIDISNAKIGDRFIFAGQEDKKQPYARQVNSTLTPPENDKVIYSGDSNYISMKITPGVTKPSQDSVNLPGTEVFGANNEMFAHLIEIKQHMQAGDNKWLSETGLKYIDEDHNNMLKSQTALGARMSMYEMSENMLNQDNVTITGDVSANEDLDVPRAIIDFKTSESVYRAALAVGARIMPPSLVDFLR